jgi:hypothetical protein
MKGNVFVYDLNLNLIRDFNLSYIVVNINLIDDVIYFHSINSNFISSFSMTKNKYLDNYSFDSKYIINSNYSLLVDNHIIKLFILEI